jgi:hypothetical protein
MSYTEATAEVFLTAFHALPEAERRVILARLHEEERETNGHSSGRRYDEAYLDQLILKARDSWKGVDDVDAWLRILRGYPNA